MKRKATINIITAAILLVAMSGTSFAIGTYMPQFQNRYGAAGSAIDTCNLCHAITPALNGYGTAFRDASRNFAAIESLDSDGDGRTNIQEITARTFPGEADGQAPPSDAIAPTVTAFSVPSSSTSLSVPITTLTATDNVAVTGYMVTELSTRPAATAANWSALKPASYTFSSAGSKRLYAWAKDAAGNVSNSLSAAVTVTATTTPPPSTSGTPDISTPSSYSFGDEEVGDSKTRSITITNRGNATLTVSRIEMAGTHASMFRAQVSSFSVAPNSTYSLSVTFTPTSEGTKTATMRLTSNDPDTTVRSIALSGRGEN